MSDARRILLVDDHPAIAELLERVFLDEGYEVVGIGTGGEQAVALAAEHHPELILMDLQMKGGDGVTATRRILAAQPDTKVVIYTVHDDPATTIAALEAGALGYLTKGSSRLEQIVEVVEQVAAGATDLSADLAQAILEGSEAADLTPRELEVLHAYAAGARSVGDVARALDISPKTAEKHLSKVYGKLDAANQLDAVLAAVERGIIDLTAGRRQPLEAADEGAAG